MKKETWHYLLLIKAIIVLGMFMIVGALSAERVFSVSGQDVLRHWPSRGPVELATQGYTGLVVDPIVTGGAETAIAAGRKDYLKFVGGEIRLKTQAERNAVDAAREQAVIDAILEAARADAEDDNGGTGLNLRAIVTVLVRYINETRSGTTAPLTAAEVRDDLRDERARRMGQ